MPTNYIYIYATILFCLLFGELQAQFNDSPSSDSSTIQIHFIRKYRVRELPSGSFKDLIGDVHLSQKDAQMWCDSGFISPVKQLRAFGNVRLKQDTTVEIKGDTLYYDGLGRKAEIRHNVILEDSSMRMYTPVIYYDLNTKIATFPDSALVVNDSSTLRSKRGNYNANTNIVHFEDSVRVQHPDYSLETDALEFDTKNKKAIFVAPTTIYSKDKTIYCEEGYYDNINQYAELRKNARYTNSDPNKPEEAWGDKIVYDGKKETYYLIGNAVYRNDKQEVRSDTILLNRKTEKYDFLGKTIFNSLDSTENQSITAKESYYDATTENMVFRKDVRFEKDEQILLADSLDYNKSKKSGIARGNVQLIDTLSNTSIFCQKVIYNDSTQTIRAEQNPILQSVIDGDTMWMRADTLISFKDTITDRNNLRGYNQVKIYKSNMQAVCDSLYYSAADSSFSFFTQPLLWVDSVQFSADTIHLKLAKKGIDLMRLRQNTFITQSDDERYYNQIKGRNGKATFKKSKIDKLYIYENSEVVYYIKDGKDLYMNVNDIDCQDILFYFKGNGIQRIKFLSQAKAVLYPMQAAKHDELQLDGFNWKIDLMPKDKFDIIQLGGMQIHKALE